MKPILFSIIVPTFNSNIIHLREMIKSIRQQSYQNWELLIIDDGSTKHVVVPVIQQYVIKDPRIQCISLRKNQGVAMATNTGISLAKGEFIVLVDHDDLLELDALKEIELVIKNNPKVDVLYSDENRIKEDGLLESSYFKSDWNPDLLLSNNYICHLTVYRKSMLQDCGGLRDGFQGAQDYDLILRISEKTTNIIHVQKLLYNWRLTETQLSQSKDCWNSGKKAIEEALIRRKIEGTVEFGIWKGSYRVTRKLFQDPLISIIISTKDNHKILDKCITSIIHKTLYKNYEIIIVNNNSTKKETFEYFDMVTERYPNKIKVLNYNKPFNFSAINNFAIQKARGEHIVLLNNDTEVIEKEWLSAMLEHSQRPEVGAVGAQLLYPNGKIQHAGVVLGMGGVADHRFRMWNDNDPGYFFRKNVIEDVSAVTAACIMFRKSIFNEVGGLDEINLAIAFNDVDFCLKIRKKGYLIVYTPYAKLWHYEGFSRGIDTLQNRRFMKENNFMLKKWDKELQRDPYWPVYIEK